MNGIYRSKWGKRGAIDREASFMKKERDRKDHACISEESSAPTSVTDEGHP